MVADARDGGDDPVGADVTDTTAVANVEGAVQRERDSVREGPPRAGSKAAVTDVVVAARFTVCWSVAEVLVMWFTLPPYTAFRT